MVAIPKASLRDSIRFNRTIVIPTALEGALLRKPRRVALVGMAKRGGLSSELGDHLRKEYGPAVYIRFARDTVLLLLDPDEIRRVLDGSPHLFGHTETKRLKMGHFEPEAVTISPDESYPERRQFNDAVLAPGRLHPMAADLHAVVRSESRAALSGASHVRWETLSELFETITLRSIFGTAGDRERRIRQLLAELMQEANGMRVPERGANYEEFRRLLETATAAASDDSLAGRARTTEPALDAAVVPDQITHWLFAMNDTLAENAARAAGLISGLPEVRARLTQELDGADLDDASAVRGLVYLNGCIQEAMRLWPTTNFIMRTCKRESIICDEPVPAGTVILIVNQLNHLDPAGVRGTAPATHFDPDRWSSGGGPYYHFGGGGQRCPGEDVALLVAAGVLATLHELGPYRTLRPSFDRVDRMPASYNPFTLEMTRG